MYALLMLPMLGTDAAPPDHDATARAALALAVAARERRPVGKSFRTYTEARAEFLNTKFNGRAYYSALIVFVGQPEPTDDSLMGYWSPLTCSVDKFFDADVPSVVIGIDRNGELVRALDLPGRPGGEAIYHAWLDLQFPAPMPAQSTPRAIPAPPPAAAMLRSDSQGTIAIRTAGAPVWCVGRS